MIAGKATLKEIETHWTLDDVLDMHEILDALDDQARLEAARNRRR